jgi:hypothetical protein
MTMTRIVFSQQCAAEIARLTKRRTRLPRIDTHGESFFVPDAFVETRVFFVSSQRVTVY